MPPDPPDPPDLTATAARVADALRQTGSVMVYRHFDGQMAATAGGRTGFGPDRDAALLDLARQIESAGTDPGAGGADDRPGSLGGIGG
jgi:hypothetical protein